MFKRHFKLMKPSRYNLLMCMCKGFHFEVKPHTGATERDKWHQFSNLPPASAGLYSQMLPSRPNFGFEWNAVPSRSIKKHHSRPLLNSKLIFATMRNGSKTNEKTTNCHFTQISVSYTLSYQVPKQYNELSESKSRTQGQL